MYWGQRTQAGSHLAPPLIFYAFVPNWDRGSSCSLILSHLRKSKFIIPIGQNYINTGRSHFVPETRTRIVAPSLNNSRIEGSPSTCRRLFPNCPLCFRPFFAASILASWSSGCRCFCRWFARLSGLPVQTNTVFCLIECFQLLFAVRHVFPGQVQVL